MMMRARLRKPTDCEHMPRRVHESTCPVDEAMVEQLTEPLHCFATVEGLAFSESDRRSGPWRNFFVGIVGAVAADENDVLWPNQVRRSHRPSQTDDHTDLAQLCCALCEEHFWTTSCDMFRAPAMCLWSPGAILQGLQRHSPPPHSCC